MSIGHSEVVIAGGGPAGLTAGIGLASEGVGTLILERDGLGGQAQWSSRIENIIGIQARGISGRLLAQRGLRLLRRFGGRLRSDVLVGYIRVGGWLTLQLLSGLTLECHALVLATGLQPKALSIPGAETFGVFCGSHPAEARKYSHRTVAVVGGGNSAGQAAEHLIAYGAEVHLISNRSMAETMSAYLLARLNRSARLYEGVQLTAISRDPELGLLTLEPFSAGRYAAVFTFIGMVPQFVGGGHPCTPDGYILAPGLRCEHDPGVFAIGDCRAGSVHRIACASGEGAAVVPLVYSYLQTLKGVAG